MVFLGKPEACLLSWSGVGGKSVTANLKGSGLTKTAQLLRTQTALLPLYPSGHLRGSAESFIARTPAVL